MTISIDSRVEPLNVGRVLKDCDEHAVKNEPMLFNCDFEHGYRLGGKITRVFLDLLPQDWQEVPLVIDSRVHMLMPGWYPCIPGWHHDDVPRTREDGQPNYAEGQCRSEHIIALVNGDICPTEFALGREEFEVPAIGRVVYEDWHREVEERLKRAPVIPLMSRPRPLVRWTCPDRILVKFNDRTWHRGTQAIANGWRFFIRASRYYAPDGAPIARGNKRTNELRRQVQVYLDNPNKGW